MAWLIDSCVLDFMQLNVARLFTGFTCGVELWSFLENAAQLSDAPLFHWLRRYVRRRIRKEAGDVSTAARPAKLQPGQYPPARRCATKAKCAPRDDSAFKTVRVALHGATARYSYCLHTYRIRYGLDTIRGMISRWAPPSENHTETYIRAVADAVGIPDGQPLDTRDRTTMLRMAAAVSRVENGAAADMGEVELGWELFVRDKPASG